MRKLYVLYDEDCGFCRRVQRWLIEQRQYVTLIPLARQSIAARQMFGPVIDSAGDDEMIVVSDEGQIWRGTHAYLVCMWALRRTRRWSFRLARPSLRPLVRGAFATLARNRYALSKLMGASDDRQLVGELRRREPPRCTSVPAADTGFK
ncbi:MAG: DUF393 domain-containing protein [Proteobacteria bacterium]|nr:DUF393 domain-containing protein [Pseudomonadota bacterium]